LKGGDGSGLFGKTPAPPMERFNASTLQRFNASTLQRFNASSLIPFHLATVKTVETPAIGV
jgi:hypothetical protein